VRRIVESIERADFSAYIDDVMTPPTSGKSSSDPERDPDREPDNVVALSRYRAQLGRGRKLRRADVLLEGPDPARAVRALPGDEFYYVVHELGLRDAGEILALARPEQIQAAFDFALWERDELVPERAGEWLEALAEAPYEKIGAWVAGLDVELFALLLRKTARVYDLSLEEAPEEPSGTLYPTPDGLFVLDVTGVGAGDDEAAGDAGPTTTTARAVMRIVDALYRADRDLARRLLVGTRAELDSELEELAYRWRQGRMADLGFADYYEALEVYRELDPTTVRLGESEPGKTRVRPLDDREGAEATAAARAPAALVERLTRGDTPFARGAQALRGAEEVAELHFALVALSNRALAADRVTPGDDAAVTATLERLLATLDLAVEFLARGDTAREAEAVRTVSLLRLHRLGTSLVGKVRRLATTLRRRGPFAALGRDLVEPDEALALEAVSRHRPVFAGILDEPPAAADRPFRSLADVARATAAVERAAATEALLVGLGVTPADLGPGSSLFEDTGLDEAALDAGSLARTVLVRRILAPAGEPPRFEALEPGQVRDFEALLEVGPGGAAKLPEVLKKKARAILAAAAPGLAGAAAEVGERWLTGLAPLEPVLVRRPPASPPPSSAAPEPVLVDRPPGRRSPKAAKKGPARRATKVSKERSSPRKKKPVKKPVKKPAKRPQRSASKKRPKPKPRARKR
jgi:hypothetical protein